MKNRVFLLCVLLTCIANNICGVNSVRERININKGWKYRMMDDTEIDTSLAYKNLKPYLLSCANDFILFGDKHERPAGNPGDNIPYIKYDFDDSGWRTQGLPHDWGIEGEFNIDYEGSTGKLPYWGVGWYRRKFDLSADDKGKRIYLNVDGAMSYASVWCNGAYVGGWPYGYASFRLDLTPYIKYGSGNILSIRIDNPQKSSRWYPGGGIYRKVWLEKTNEIHVAQWGTFVRTENVTNSSAKISMGVTIENHKKNDVKLSVSSIVYKQDANGNPVGEKEAESLISDIVVLNENKKTVNICFDIDKPNLWTLDNPNLYVVKTQLYVDNQLVDSYYTQFGIRTVDFTSNDGIMLNGEKIKIKGVCLHHDLGALGTAFNKCAAERQLRIMKEMGCNAIRTSHNPPAPELVELCDRMGIMMQLELADTWHTGKIKNDYSVLFDDWSEADMRSLVRHYRNNPSVIMWSIGNEVPDQLTKVGVDIAHRLTSYCHDEDPTRPTTLGCNKPEAMKSDIVNQVDIWGLNYSLMAYSEFNKQNPNRRRHGSETVSATSSRGEYFFPVTGNPDDSKQNFQLSSYDMSTVLWGTSPDNQFKYNEEYPTMYGEFVWSGFDYIGEPTPYNKDLTNLLNFNNKEDMEKAKLELERLGKIKSPSRSSYFGIVDLCGFPKDRYYAYRSYWRKEIPTLHIFPHWNWEGREGEITPVHIYTSGDSVELFLNGKSMGHKKKEKDYERLTWDSIRYEPGELRAIAYKNGKRWDEKVVETTGKAHTIQLVPEKSELKSDGEDLLYVKVLVVDKENRIVPTSNNYFHSTISGPAHIIATDNGNPTDHTSFKSPERNVFNGMGLIIVKAKDGMSGNIRLKVSSKGLKSGVLKLNVIN